MAGSIATSIGEGTMRGRFEQDGFLCGIRAQDADGAGRIRREFDRLEAAEGREKCRIGLLDRHFDQPFVWELATHPAILNAVEAVMGPDILLLATHFFCKYPETEGVQAFGRSGVQAPTPERLNARTPERPVPRYVAWHQDVTYWGLEPPLAVTAWYAVDDSDVENGCMRVIPGTHDAIREHRKAERAGNLLSINQEVPVTAEEEARAVDLCLRAGEVSLHHGMLIHGSNPNLSPRRRCGLTIRYVPPHVRQVAINSQGRTWQAVLVRGNDPYRHFGERQPPF
jgi:phytanoyl-CoA dioxygenase PhyH